MAFALCHSQKISVYKIRPTIAILDIHNCHFGPYKWTLQGAHIFLIPSTTIEQCSETQRSEQDVKRISLKLCMHVNVYLCFTQRITMLCKLMNKSDEQLRKMLQGLTTSESMDLSQLLLNSPKTPPVRTYLHCYLSCFRETFWKRAESYHGNAVSSVFKPLPNTVEIIKKCRV